MAHYTTSDAPAKWDELHRLIGCFAQESSMAHWLIFEMFRTILSMDRDQASELYYTMRADSAQREVTLAVLTDRLTSPEGIKLLERIKIAFNEVGKTSGRRNGFIHTPWSMWHGTEEFVTTDGVKLHPKLKPVDVLGQAVALVAELRRTNSTLLALCDELERIAPPKKK